MALNLGLQAGEVPQPRTFAPSKNVRLIGSLNAQERKLRACIAPRGVQPVSRKERT